jgi:hypothetical protein
MLLRRDRRDEPMVETDDGGSWAGRHAMRSPELGTKRKISIFRHLQEYRRQNIEQL